MGKGMTIAGMVVAVLIFILFAVDLVFGFPFGRGPSLVIDILFVIASLALAFLCWSTLKDFD